MDHSLDVIKKDIFSLLGKSGLLSEREVEPFEEDFSIARLHGDGSSRRFYRVLRGSLPFCIAVYPSGSGPKGLAEYSASHTIGRHLERVGLPVPHILAAEDRLGLLLFEDLGDTRLHDYLLKDRQKGLALYPEILRILARLQTDGRRGFDPGWCHDGSRYDKEVMVSRESGYFYRSFWQDTLKGGEIPGLQDEFTKLAEIIEPHCQPLFLHRDFQSRNLMIYKGRIRVIDYQAGRLGPPAYDLASVLIDPYSALSDAEQSSLLDLYCSEIQDYPEISADQVRISYPYLALQRNLQIIGAFAFLTGPGQKIFFRQYIRPALIALNQRIADPLFHEFKVLRNSALHALQKFEAQMGG